MRDFSSDSTITPRRLGAPLTTQEAVREPYVGSLRVRLAGFGVHVYTASGSVLALLIVVAAMDGAVIRALWLSLAALVIDGTDGMLARKLRVSETIPGSTAPGSTTSSTT